MGERYDFLVIGSGLAGLFAALTLREHGRVALITKRALEDSNSYFAREAWPPPSAAGLAGPSSPGYLGGGGGTL